MLFNSWLILLLTSICFAAPTDPTDENEGAPPILTNENFDNTISNGTWWIKFYSPYCPHCKEFAPIWKEIFQEVRKEADEHNFYFGSVNCAQDGDLCDRLNILAYPNLQIFEKGELVNEYGTRDRNKEPVQKFYNNWINGIRPTPTAAATAPSTSSVPPSANTSPPKFVPIDDAPTTTSSSLPLPNQNGESVDLTHVDFEKTVRRDQRGWLIKFHSPKCPHCLEMKSDWAAVASKLQNNANVGEINCDRNSALCNEMHISKIPAIKFFYGESESEYRGLRTENEILAFGKNAAESPNIKEVNAEELDELVKATNAGGLKTGRVTVNFVYFYDDATVKEDYDALRRMSVSVIGNAKVYKTNDKELVNRMKVRQFPSLYAVTDINRWIQYEAKTPKDIRNNKEMSKWARRTWLSLVPQLTPANARDILDNAKYVVIAVIDPKEIDDHTRAIKELKQTALTLMENNNKQDADEIERQRAKKQLKLDEATAKKDHDGLEKAKKIRVNPKKKPTVGFAWIDKNYWDTWIKGRYGSTHGLRSKPRVIINDEHGSRYWDSTPRGNPIDVVQSQLLDCLESIFDKHDDSMKPKALHNSITGYFVHLKVLFWQYWHWIAIGALVLVIIKTRKMRRNGGDGNSVYHAVESQEVGKLD